MGMTTGYYCADGIKGIDKFFEHHFDNLKFVSKGYLVKRPVELRDPKFDTREYYRAFKLADGSVIAFVALVDLTDIKRNEIGEDSWTEDMGPVVDHCPLAVLKMLTTPANEYASNWRARCFANAATKRAAHQTVVKRVDGHIRLF